MKINDDHFNHGAAITQIAEHPQFTAINAFTMATGISRSAFMVNNNIGVYLKYATKPNRSHTEYVFTFTSANLTELDSIDRKCSSVFLALVCVRARQICCLSYADFKTLRAARRTAKGATEPHYSLLVTVPTGKSFRVYMNTPGRRNKALGKPLVVSRNKFPGAIF